MTLKRISRYRQWMVGWNVFLMAPQAECHQVPLYWRAQMYHDLDDWEPSSNIILERKQIPPKNNISKPQQYTKKQSELILAIQVKGETFDFGVKYTFKLLYWYSPSLMPFSRHFYCTIPTVNANVRALTHLLQYSHGFLSTVWLDETGQNQDRVVLMLILALYI